MTKRRYEKIMIDGKQFTLDTKETIGYTPIPQRSIYDVYQRCSTAKRNIYLSWVEWFTKNNGWCDVCSHNSNFFSMQGYIRNYETREMYFCYITPANNRCIRVEEPVI